jgi:hypothetical protein
MTPSVIAESSMTLLKTFTERIAERAPEDRDRNFCVFNKTEESFLGLNVIRADTSFARLRGLLGRSALKSGDGLWLAPSQGVHTIGVLFPVDVVYLDADDRVIQLVEHLGPFRIGPLRLKSATVLELPPHTIYGSKTCVGHQLMICRAEEMQAYLRNASKSGELQRGLQLERAR